MYIALDKRKSSKIVLAITVILFVAGYLIPGDLEIPVEGASKQDWHADTFWYEPWGKSGVHKGIDIFAAKGARLNSASHGLVVYSGEMELGGNVVLILGAGWKLHYYAHLDSKIVDLFDIVSSGQVIGAVGDSGNASGKQPHLHYSIITLIPFIWRIDTSTQGWKKIFYLDPGTELQA